MRCLAIPALLTLSACQAGDGAQSANAPADTNDIAIHAVDLTGVDQFWAYADRIQAGDELGEADWDAFFAHPGYAFIQRAGQRRAPIELCMQAAFAPEARQAEAQASVAAAVDAAPDYRKRVYPRVCAHLAGARDRRDEITAYRSDFQLGEMSQTALQATAEYLPDGLIETGAPPRAYAMLFEDNGFGGAVLAIDLLSIMEQSEIETINLLGHEFHHAYRDQIQRESWPQPAVRLMVQLDRMVHEGLASMIDKAPYLRAGDDPPGLSPGFLDQVSATPERLAVIDAALASLQHEADGYDAAARVVSGALPTGGHVNGVYMAMAIEDALGREQLIASMTGPLAFIRAYNEAALQLDAGHYVFSDAALENLGLAAGED